MIRHVRSATILTLALLMLFPALAVLSAGPPAERRTMPTLGHNGAGEGWCVNVEGSPFIIDVDRHALTVEARQRQNSQMEADERSRGLAPGTKPRLSLDAGDIFKDYAENTRNAYRHAAQLSGNAELMEAAEGSLEFVDLGIAVEGTSPKKSQIKCMKSSCYGKPPGCIVSGCVPGCADCLTVVVTPTIQ